MPLSFEKKEAKALEYLQVPGDPNGLTIILFHGFGANATDLLSIAEVWNESPKPTWIFPEAPLKIEIAPGYYGQAWFPIDFGILQKAYQNNCPEEALKAFPLDLTSIRKIIENFLAELKISPSKLLLGGFSQGAILTLDFTLHFSSRLAGILLFSGCILPYSNLEKLASQFSDLPFFLSHGIYDPILPFSLAEKLESLLLKAHWNGRLDSFNGGHEIPPLILLQLKHFFTKFQSDRYCP